jgi:hypothetical protein
MDDLAGIPTHILREAADAWRRAAVQEQRHRDRAGWLKWLMPQADMSLHDRIDDLIDEVQRLRSAA